MKTLIIPMLAYAIGATHAPLVAAGYGFESSMVIWLTAFLFGLNSRRLAKWSAS